MSVVISKNIDISTVPSGGTFDLGWRGNGGVLFVNPTGYIVSLGLQSQSGPLAVLPGQMWKFPLTPQDASVTLQKTLFTSTALSTLLYWTVFNDPHDLDDVPQGQFSSYIANIIGGAGVTAQTLLYNGPQTDVVSITQNSNLSGNPNVDIKADGTVIINALSNGVLWEYLFISPSSGGPGAIFIPFNTGANAPTLSLQPSALFLTNSSQAPQSDKIWQLATGNQETGFCGWQEQATIVSANGGAACNFKMQMTNVPSSITLTVIQHTNIATNGAFNIKKFGFNVSGTATAAGNAIAFDQYTTVGNCLLAFDKDNKTYHHHCDTCNTKTFDNSYDRLQVLCMLDDNGNRHFCIAHFCPVCKGAVQECFNPDLTENDIVSPLHRLTKDFCEHVLSTRSQ